MKRLHAEIIDTGPLTKKEAQVLRYLCEGYLQKQIAAKIFRTKSAVGKHLESIYEKLDCHCAAEVVSTSIAMGLVNIKIEFDYSIPTKIVILLLAFNILFNHMDARQPPRMPRPQRIARTQMARSVRKS